MTIILVHIHFALERRTPNLKPKKSLNLATCNGVTLFFLFDTYEVIYMDIYNFQFLYLTRKASFRMDKYVMPSVRFF